MENLTRVEIETIVPSTPMWEMTPAAFEAELASILADFPNDRTMQTLHCIRYRHFLERQLHQAKSA